MFADAHPLWPYLVILLVGALPTDIWRYIGVIFGTRLAEDSEILRWVRAVATALIAAVIAKLIIYPTGALATVPLLLRLGAVAFGFVAFLLGGKRILVGVIAGALALIAGQMLLLGL